MHETSRGQWSASSAWTVVLLFLGVHVLVAALGWVYPSQPMGDVYLVYEPWSRDAVTGGAIQGITQDWVYPPFALVPLLVVQFLSGALVPLMAPPFSYIVAWAIFVTILDLVALAVLVFGGRSAARVRAGGIWTLALLLLGPVALYRLDAVTVPLAVLGGLWLWRRPMVAAAVLALATWMKIWPGALIAAAFVALRRRLAVLWGVIVPSVLIVLTVIALGGGAHLLGFIGEQTGRGLQIEAVLATPFLWAALAGHARIAYSSEILTFQIDAPGAEAISAATTPLLALLVLGIAAAGAWRMWRGTDPRLLLPPLALAITLALILANKVGSPQFMVWLLAPTLLWAIADLRRSRAATVLVLLLCALTCLVYPLTYDALLRAEVVPILLLTARNALLLVLFVVTMAAMLRTRPGPSEQPAATSAATDTSLSSPATAQEETLERNT